jgi:hypothetical protein
MIRIFKISWLLLLMAGCSVRQNGPGNKLPFAGEWKFRIDSLDQGVENR